MFSAMGKNTRITAIVAIAAVLLIAVAWLVYDTTQ